MADVVQYISVFIMQMDALNWATTSFASLGVFGLACIAVLAVLDMTVESKELSSTDAVEGARSGVLNHCTRTPSLETSLCE